MTQRVVVVGVGRPSFLLRDANDLEAVFEVSLIHWDPHHLVQSMWRLWKELSNADGCYAVLAGGHAAVAATFCRLRRLPFVVLVGGYEVADMSDIGYGALTSTKERMITRCALRGANRIVCVDPELKDDLARFDPESHKRCVVIRNGVDVPEKLWAPHNDGPITMVAGGSDAKRFLVKGSDLFLKLASTCPDLQFMLIGPSGNHAKAVLHKAPPNLICTGPLPHDETLRRIRTARFYVQMSRREGHPNALLEAIAAGVPFAGTNRQGIRSVIQHDAFLFQEDPGSWAAQLRAWLDRPAADWAELRKDVLADSDPDIRRQNLCAVVEEAMNPP